MILKDTTPVHVHNPKKTKREHGGVVGSVPEINQYKVVFKKRRLMDNFFELCTCIFSNFEVRFWFPNTSPHNPPPRPRYVNSQLTVPTTAGRGEGCGHENEELLEKLKIKQNLKNTNYYYLKPRQV